MLWKSSNVVIDDCKPNTINHDEEVDVIDDSPRKKSGEILSDIKSSIDEEVIQPFDRDPSLDSKEPTS